MDLVNLFQVIIMGGFATTIATKILTSDLVKIPFEKYKRLTALAVSFLSSGVALYQQGLNVASLHVIASSWQSIATVVLGVFVTSAIVYNNILRINK